MAKFRKKPVVIEAEQYRHPSMQPRGVCFCTQGAPVASEDPSESRAHVHTIHDGQIVMLEPGDWIIPEPDGEHFYPCKDSIFQATYEPVDD